MRLIDADALKALVAQRHDFFRGCTNAPEKARRDELLQVMCDINEQPDVDAIPVEWLRNLCAIAKMEIDDEMFIDWLIQTWQEEQEAR